MPLGPVTSPALVHLVNAFSLVEEIAKYTSPSAGPVACRCSSNKLSNFQQHSREPDLRSYEECRVQNAMLLPSKLLAPPKCAHWVRSEVFAAELPQVSFSWSDQPQIAMLLTEPPYYLRAYSAYKTLPRPRSKLVPQNGVNR